MTVETPKANECYEGHDHEWSGASYSAAWNCNVQCCRLCGHLRRAEGRPKP